MRAIVLCAAVREARGSVYADCDYVVFDRPNMAGQRMLRATVTRMSDPGVVAEIAKKQLPAVFDIEIDSRQMGRDMLKFIVRAEYVGELGGFGGPEGFAVKVAKAAVA